MAHAACAEAGARSVGAVLGGRGGRPSVRPKAVSRQSVRIGGAGAERGGRVSPSTF